MKSLYLTLGSFLTLISTTVYSQLLSGGRNHSLNVCTNGTPMAWGYNAGALGDGTSSTRYTPTTVSLLNNIIDLSAGAGYSLFVKSDGTVWACGANIYGALGDSTITNTTTPVMLNTLNNITAVSAGRNYNHSLFLKNDGTVWACGHNGDGQLGDGSYTTRQTPIIVQSLTNVVAISAGVYHSLFLKNDGTVWGAGNNANGELGYDLNTLPKTNTPVQIPNLSGIIAISTGIANSIFLKNDGTVWVCGDNMFGELGNDVPTEYIRTPTQISSLSNIIAISGGIKHTLFLKNDGTVWACGANGYGQLGNGTTSFIVDSPSLVSNITGVTNIAAGESFSLFKKADGTVWGCGYNAQGQLGDGTGTDRYTPVQTSNLCTAFNNINDVTVDDKISIYPNPASNQLHITSNNKQVDILNIYNTTGVLISTNITPQSNIDISNLSNGIYIAEILFNNTIVRKRWVKM